MDNFSGVFSLKSNQIDIFAWPAQLTTQERIGQLGYYNKIFETKKIVVSEPFKVAHFLNEPNLKNTDFSSFLYNNFGILTIILLGYLLVKLSTFVFLKLSNRNHSFFENLKLVLFRIFRINQNVSSTLGLLFLSLNLFLFFNLTLLSGTIKTESVVVNTTDLLDSIDKIMNTDRILIINYDAENILSDAPGNSFLKKLYDKKTKANEICVIKQTSKTDTFKKIVNHGLDNYLIFGGDIISIQILAVLSYYSIPGSISFMKSSIYYESLGAFPIRKNLDENKKKLIYKNIDIALENGFLINMMTKIQLLIKSRLKENAYVFKRKEEFVDEFTSASNVKFANYKRIFIAFFSILIIILIVFVFQKYHNRFKKFYFHLKRAFYSLYKLFVKCIFIIKK